MMLILAPYRDASDPQVHEYLFDPTLGDSGYHIRLAWDERRTVWTCDITDQDGEGVSGEVVEPYKPIGRTSRITMPAGGALIPIPASGEDSDLEWEDLGYQVLLVWFDDDELPAHEAIDDGYALVAGPSGGGCS